MGSYHICPATEPKPHLPAIFHFGDLVYDIQAYIISSFVCVQDLYSLTLVSRHINSLASPALYTDVRLLLGCKSSPWNFRVEGAFTKALSFAQLALQTQVLSQPENARRIRSLAWQVCSSYGSSGHPFTDFFPLLDNLTTIHVVDAHPTSISELNYSVTKLFPRVKTVKFTGTTSLSLVTPMLHTPQHLTALSLDTVEPHTVHMHLLHWISIADLSNLRIISLRALYQQLRNSTRQTEILFSWKEALSTVRRTVHEVTLGFREQSTTCFPNTLPSTEEFAQSLLPIFWEESWPHLNTLRLEGLLIDGPEGEVVPPLGTRLRAAVPQADVHVGVHGVQRVWNEESLKYF